MTPQQMLSLFILLVPLKDNEFVFEGDCENVFVSFSGGQTSAFMAWFLLMFFPHKNYIFVFANTGQEHPETYRFIRLVEEWLGVTIICIERVFGDPDRIYRVVPLDKLTRDKSLFEAMVKEYGISNMDFPHCTRELKTRPMHAYVRELWGDNYTTAIGMRADEFDRVNENYQERRWWYPLAWNGIKKQDVIEFWNKAPFKLEIPGYLGNCVWCWKKTWSKHMKIIKEEPQWYDTPKFIEKKYEINQIESQLSRVGKKQTFFRKNMTAEDLFAEYERDSLGELTQMDLFDNYENSCAERCDPDWGEL